MFRWLLRLKSGEAAQPQRNSYKSSGRPTTVQHFSREYQNNVPHEPAVVIHMREMLVILAGTVPTPERGYERDGGLSLLQADVKTLVRELKAAREELEVYKLKETRFGVLRTPPTRPPAVSNQKTRVFDAESCGDGSKNVQQVYEEMRLEQEASSNLMFPAYTHIDVAKDKLHHETHRAEVDDSGRPDVYQIDSPHESLRRTIEVYPSCDSGSSDCGGAE